MASREHKIVQRAEAMSQLGFLSQLLAEQLNIQIPDVQVTNRDAELAEIQRIENINQLLTQVLEAHKPIESDKAELATETEKKPTKSMKHGTKQ
jgi:ABC-type xylose transport system substrate-binding protein